MAERSDSTLNERVKVLLSTLARVSNRPVTAIELAEAMNITGTHESRRRRVRETARYARECLGHRVCAGSGASDDCGYWMARDADEWASYLEAARNGARFRFAGIARAKRAVVERMGKQQRLFAQ
ncbi:MAG: hypothetical protein J5J06_05530 [Phycisphaerae bacterium]|nr:hypothetical protein [Phycisphaerae bacterium]